MYASHQSLREDYEVSCDELDVLVDLARERGVPGGVFGSRMTGAGFGGCTVSLVQAHQVDAIAAHLARGYTARTGIAPTMFVSRPAAGAGVVN
jgi:galactokinase